MPVKRYEFKDLKPKEPPKARKGWSDIQKSVIKRKIERLEAAVISLKHKIAHLEHKNDE